MFRTHSPLTFIMQAQSDFLAIECVAGNATFVHSFVALFTTLVSCPSTICLPS